MFSESAGRAASKRAAARRSSALERAEREKSNRDNNDNKSKARTDEEVFEAEADLEEEEGFKWGLATAVACLPLVGFTAWAFAAVDEAANASSSSSSSPSSSSATSRAPLYWAFAGIYALASLRHGLSLDAGAVAVALACAAHVQVERLSSGGIDSGLASLSSSSSKEGEEEDFEVLFGRKKRKSTPAKEAAEATSRAAARAAGVAAESAAAVARAVKAGLEDDDDDNNESDNGDGVVDRKALPADTRRRPPSKEDVEDRKYDADLLRTFDERLAEREREREGGSGGGGGRS